MKHQPRALFLACFIAVAGSASAAGTATVSFIDVSRYSDAGTTHWDDDANLKTLAKYIEGLGTRYLHDGQVLKVELLDVDLAGAARPSRRDGSNLRIVKGRADFPRIGLRYTLEEDGKPVRSGEESVADLDYTHGLVGGARNYDSLYYEKHMLEKWFRASFAEGRAAAD